MLLNYSQPGGIGERSMFWPVPTGFGRGEPSGWALVSKMPAARMSTTCHCDQVPQRRRFHLQTWPFPITIFPFQVSCGAQGWPAQQATLVPGKPPRESMGMGAVCLSWTCWCLSGSYWTGACLAQHRLMVSWIIQLMYPGRFFYFHFRPSSSLWALSSCLSPLTIGPCRT